MNTITDKPFSTYPVDPEGKELRKKFAMLVAIHPLLCPIRMIARLGALFTGDFYRAGVAIADRKWIDERKIAYVKGDSIPQEMRKTFLKCQHVFLECVKNVAKIALCPLESVALFVISGLGLTLLPRQAREWHGKIEYFFARDLTRVDRRSLFYRASDIAAICLLNRGVWDRENIYKGYPDYNSLSLRSLIRELKGKIDQAPEFYEKKLGKDAFASVKKYIEDVQQNLKKLSFKDSNETNTKGKLIEKKDGDNRDISSYLSTVRATLKMICDNLEAQDASINNPQDVKLNIEKEQEGLQVFIKDSERWAMPCENTLRYILKDLGCSKEKEVKGLAQRFMSNIKKLSESDFEEIDAKGHLRYYDDMSKDKVCSKYEKFRMNLESLRSLVKEKSSLKDPKLIQIKDDQIKQKIEELSLELNNFLFGSPVKISSKIAA